MPRQLKPFKVRDISHESGVEFEIFMDRNTNPVQFFAEIFGERVNADTEGECKKRALKKATEAVSYEWRKIVVVSTSSSYHERNKLSLSYRIHEIAESVSDDYTVERRFYGNLPFGINRDREFTINRYQYQKKSDPNRCLYVLDYTEELEEALKEINRRIAFLCEQLDTLLNQDNAAELIVTSLNKMLPAPLEEP